MPTMPAPNAVRLAMHTPPSEMIARARSLAGWVGRAVDDPNVVFEPLGVFAVPVRPLSDERLPVWAARVWRPRTRQYPARQGLLGVWWTPAGWRAKDWDLVDPPETWTPIQA